jgi:hypothetical protein
VDGGRHERSSRCPVCCVGCVDPSALISEESLFVWATARGGRTDCAPCSLVLSPDPSPLVSSTDTIRGRTIRFQCCRPMTPLMMPVHVGNARRVADVLAPDEKILNTGVARLEPGRGSHQLGPWDDLGGVLVRTDRRMIYRDAWDTRCIPYGEVASWKTRRWFSEPIRVMELALRVEPQVSFSGSRMFLHEWCRLLRHTTRGTD